MAAFERALAISSTTLVQAAGAVAIGWVLALATSLLRSASPRIDHIYRPVIIAAFCIPTFTLSFFASAAGLPNGFAWLIVGLTLVTPLEVAISGAQREATAISTAKVGSAWRRAVMIRGPAALPTILMGSALVVPWALLGTMLVEMVEGGQGLGVRLISEAQNGFGAQLPFITVALLISGGAYVILTTVSGSIRTKLGLGKLPPRSAILPAKGLEFGTGALLWSALLVLLIWLLLSASKPVTVGDPFNVALLERMAPPIAIAALQSGISLVASLVVGSGLGASIVVLSLRWPVAAPLVRLLLLPLQILPIHIFAIPLLAATLMWNPPMTMDLVVHVAPDATAMLIGSLTTAYLTIHYLSSWVMLLPGRTSGLLSVYSATSAPMLRYVYLPWLLQGAGAFLTVLVPRLILAVVMTEYLFTKLGLGGTLVSARSNRDFQGTFVIVITLIALALTIQTVSTYFTRHVLRGLGESRT